MKVLRVIVAQWPFANAAVDVNRHRHRPADRRGQVAAAAASPQQRLRRCERSAPAGWADPLIVLGVTALDLVPVAELLLHLAEVLYVHERGERMSAAESVRLLLGAPNVLVEAHAEVRGAVEDVEELPEGEAED